MRGVVDSPVTTFPYSGLYICMASYLLQHSTSPLISLSPTCAPLHKRRTYILKPIPYFFFLLPYSSSLLHLPRPPSSLLLLPFSSSSFIFLCVRAGESFGVGALHPEVVLYRVNVWPSCGGGIVDELLPCDRAPEKVSRVSQC